MPKNSVHCAISKKRTGKTYKNLHSWIDNNKEDDSVNHRSKNHFYSDEIRKYIYENFGGHEAVSEWLFHVALDNLETSYKNDQMRNVSDSNFHCFGFEKNGFIHYCKENHSRKDFENNFPEDFEGENAEIFENLSNAAKNIFKKIQKYFD